MADIIIAESVPNPETGVQLKERFRDMGDGTHARVVSNAGGGGGGASPAGSDGDLQVKDGSGFASAGTPAEMLAAAGVPAYVDVDWTTAADIDNKVLKVAIPAAVGSAAYPIRWELRYIPGSRPYTNPDDIQKMSLAAFNGDLTDDDPSSDDFVRKWEEYPGGGNGYEFTAALDLRPLAGSGFPVVGNDSEAYLPLIDAPYGALVMQLSRTGDPLATRGIPATFSLGSPMPGYVVGQKILGATGGATPGASNYTDDLSIAFVLTVATVNTAGEPQTFTVSRLGTNVYTAADNTLDFNADNGIVTGQVLNVLVVDRVARTVTVEGDYVSTFTTGTMFNVDAQGCSALEENSTLVGGNTVIVLSSLDQVVPFIPVPANAFNIHAENSMVPKLPLFLYTITAVNTGDQKFTISGNHASDPIAGAGFVFSVVGSSANDGAYTTVSAVNSGGDTVITVAEVIPDGTADGTINPVGFVSGHAQTVNVDTVTPGNGVLRARVWCGVAQLDD